jgi:DNA primase
MNCEQANQIDLVDYLYTLGFNPKKIRRENHWYSSPLRQEKEASFKVNKNKNVWYDHGLGKGGSLVDFAKEFYSCNVSEALPKIALFHPQKFGQNIAERPPVHLHQNAERNDEAAGETAIKIISAKQPITDPNLCSYLLKRKIEKNIANRYCHEINFTIAEKEYRAIGFKNNAGGYELRNEFFKGSNSPKYVSYLDNNAGNITVFEGYFDFLSYQSIHQNKEYHLTNFLVLNSLSFFERSLLLMEKHECIHLYLDNDEAGRKCTTLAQKRSLKFKDESKLYEGCKDLNEWNVKHKEHNINQKINEVKHQIRRHL